MPNPNDEETSGTDREKGLHVRLREMGKKVPDLAPGMASMRPVLYVLMGDGRIKELHKADYRRKTSECNNLRRKMNEGEIPLEVVDAIFQRIPADVVE